MAKVYRAIVEVNSQGLSVAHVEMIIKEALARRCNRDREDAGITGYSVEILKSEICVWGHGNCSLTMHGPCSSEGGGLCLECTIGEHDCCPLVDGCRCCDLTKEGMKNE